MKTVISIALIALLIHSVAAFTCFARVAADPYQAPDTEFGMPGWDWLISVDAPSLYPASILIDLAFPVSHPSNAKVLGVVLVFGGAQWLIIAVLASLAIRALISSRRFRANVA